MSPRALIVSEVPSGRTEGSERMITEIAALLTATGEAALHTVAPGRGPRWSEALRGAGRATPGVEVLHYYPVGSLTRPALVRARLWRRSVPGAALVYHAFQMPASPLPKRLTIRGLLGPRTLLVTPSAELARRLESGIPVMRVPAAVDTSHFRPPSPGERAAARGALGVAQDAFLVLHAGHARASRNLGVLADLARGKVAVAFVLSPRFAPEDAVVSMLREAGVRVVTGAQDLRTWYWAADCYLFPVVDASAAVGLPLSVLEALACGLTVVSTRFDGLFAELGETWPGIRWASPSEMPLAVAGLSAGPARQDPASLASPVAARFGLPAVLDAYRAAYAAAAGIPAR